MRSESERAGIALSVLRLGSEVEESVLGVLRSGMIVQGPMVERLEHTFAEMIGAKHVVAVNNGTTALIAALQILQLEPGDEVITSPFTFAATLNAILQVGATARFADITEDDFNVDPDRVADLIGPSTKVLMPVHLYGQMADMGSLTLLASAHGLDIIEDAAQSHLASFEGRRAGTWGIGCFSLYATKNLTSGEGGLISTDDATIAESLRVLRNQGMRQRYQYEMVGSNFRMTDLHAAVCVPQLAAYAENVDRRRHNAAALSQALAGVDWLRTPQVLPGREHVWHQYTVLVDQDSPVTRDQLLQHLGEQGIGCGVYYPKVAYDYDVYRNHPGVRLDEVPVAASVVGRCLSLPVHPYLERGDVERIADAIASVDGT